MTDEEFDALLKDFYTDARSLDTVIAYVSNLRAKCERLRADFDEIRICGRCGSFSTRSPPDGAISEDL